MLKQGFKMLIFNASPLINLCNELNRADLLTLIKENIDSSLCVPHKVNEELKDGKTRKTIDDLLDKKCLVCEIKLDLERFSYLENKHFSLGQGELSAITLAEQTKSTVVLDEKKARSVAKELNIEYIGIFGLTLKLYKEEILNINELKSIAKQMHESIAFRIDLNKLGYSWLIK